MIVIAGGIYLPRKSAILQCSHQRRSSTSVLSHAISIKILDACVRACEGAETTVALRPTRKRTG